MALRRLIVFGILVALIFAAQSSAESAPNAPAPPPAPVNIGVMAEFSGPFSGIGDECRRGYELAVAAAKETTPDFDSKVRIVYGDHQRDAKSGVSELKRLIDVEHAAVVVFNSSAVAMAINPVSRERGFPIIGTVAHPKFTENPFAFRVWPNSKDEGAVLAARAFKLGYRRAAVVTLEDDYTLSVSAAFVEKFTAVEGKILLDERIQKDESDFSTIAARIRAAKVDVVFLDVIGDQLAALIRRLREAGVTQSLIGTFSLGKSEIRAASGINNLKGAFYTEINGERPHFQSRVHEVYGLESVSGLTYAAYLALAAAITVALEESPPSGPKDFLARLQSLDAIPTLDGEVQIKAREAQLDLLFRAVADTGIERIQ